LPWSTYSNTESSHTTYMMFLAEQCIRSAFCQWDNYSVENSCEVRSGDDDDNDDDDDDDDDGVLLSPCWSAYTHCVPKVAVLYQE
jgi:hypothetical protein